jgi:hypothetical protein
MKLTDAAIFGGRHVLAAICSTVFVTAVPIIAYGILVIIGVTLYGDMGGPLNFIIVPILSFLLGAAITSLVYAPLSLIFEFAQKRSHIPTWVPPLLFFTASFLILLALFLREPPPPLVLIAVTLGFALFFTIGFCIYWLTTTFSDMSISFIRKMANKAMQRIGHKPASR